MAQRKISELPVDSNVTGSEELITNDSGVSRKVTIANAVAAVEPKSHTHNYEPADVDIQTHINAAHAPSNANNYSLPSSVVHDNELSSSTSSTSTSTGANSAAVKAAYDKGNHSHSTVCTSGTATTAATLATARTIAGVSFDGSANISLNNNAITNGAGYITSYTNTTYSAGAGLDLSGTTFSIESDLREGGTTSDRYWGNTDDYIFADASHGLRFYSSGTEGIRLDTSNNTQIYGTLVETSAAMYKENIVNLPNQLDNIMKLRPVEYDRINSGNHEVGLIADEVQKVLPQLVSTKDGKPEALNYTRMVSVLVKAVQELTAKVEGLTKK